MTNGVQMVTATFLVATTLSCAFIRAASFELGTVRGVVLGADDLAPLAGAQIRILNTRLKGTTDSAGRFELTNVPVGTRRVEATRTGYRAVLLRQVDVGRSQATCTVAFLQPAPTRRVAARNTAVTSPLVIVDAVVRQSIVPAQSFSVAGGETINVRNLLLPAIPRENIATVEVVQPSAGRQLYGERGALGVIVLTTRPQARC